MSCLSSPPGVDVDRRRRGHKAEAEGRPALDMLDEFWFFSNTLGKQDDGRGMRRPPLLPKSPSTSSASGGRTKGTTHHSGGKGRGSDDQQQQQQAGNSSKSRFFVSGSRRLLRTPSLPAPRIGMEELPKDEEIVDEDAAAAADQEVEVEDDDLNWSSIYEGVLRTRIAEEERRSSSAALHRAPSMPAPPSATMSGAGRRGVGHETATMSTPSMPRLQHSYSTLERHCRSHTPTKPDRSTPRTTGGSKPERGLPRRELRSFSAAQQPAIARHTSALQLQDKMWKSSSALESIEVQGFKDLGFVFDKEELRESLADVLPGLRDSKAAAKPNKSSGSVSAGSGSASDDNDDANGNGNESAVGDGGIVRRPYLSEAWHHGARSAPPAAGIRLQQADARSAAEMKDQIRMWAQAVACNVRQEC